MPSLLFIALFLFSVNFPSKPPNRYLIEKLLSDNHKVVGIDNDWKYGDQDKNYDNHPNYFHYHGDVKDVDLLKLQLEKHKVDYFVAAAAWIGGISFS